MPTIPSEAETVVLPPAPGGGPALRPRPQLSAADAHRLALQAKLTEIGVPPCPGDRGALRRLACLDSGSVDAVLRWLCHAAGVPRRVGETFPEALPEADGPPIPAASAFPAAPAMEPPAAEPALVEPPPGVDAPTARPGAHTRRDARAVTPPAADAPPAAGAPTHPADRMDPRLLAW